MTIRIICILIIKIIFCGLWNVRHGNESSKYWSRTTNNIKDIFQNYVSDYRNAVTINIVQTYKSNTYANISFTLLVTLPIYFRGSVSHCI